MSHHKKPSCPEPSRFLIFTCVSRLLGAASEICVAWFQFIFSEWWWCLSEYFSEASGSLLWLVVLETGNGMSRLFFFFYKRSILRKRWGEEARAPGLAGSIPFNAGSGDTPALPSAQAPLSDWSSGFGTRSGSHEITEPECSLHAGRGDGTSKVGFQKTLLPLPHPRRKGIKPYLFGPFMNLENYCRNETYLICFYGGKTLHWEVFLTEKC